MNEFDPPSACQALCGAVEIFDSPLIQVVKLTLRSPAPHKCRDRLDKETKLALAFAQGFLGTLPLVDVDEQVVPADNVPVRIPKRKAARLKPAVDTIETSGS